MHGTSSKLELVLYPVRDLLRGSARRDGSLGDGLRDHIDETWIEWSWNDIVRAKRESLALVRTSDFIRHGLSG